MGELRKTNNAGGNPRISEAKPQRRLCEAAIALTQNLRNLCRPTRLGIQIGARRHYEFTTMAHRARQRPAGKYADIQNAHVLLLASRHHAGEILPGPRYGHTRPGSTWVQ